LGRGTGRDVRRLDAVKTRKPEVDDDALAAMRQAFGEQVSEELYRTAQRYARQRASMVRGAGRRIDSLYARELVQDALTDTWLGKLTWHPANCSLLWHVRGVIQSRSWKDALWAKRCSKLSLEVNDTGVAIGAGASHHRTVPPQEHPLMISNLTVAIVRELRRLALGDRAATLVLSAWEEGKANRSEVIEHTGLSPIEYRMARDRLTYLVRELPRSLDDAARNYLRRAS
jgi:hypothetical protein